MKRFYRIFTIIIVCMIIPSVVWSSNTGDNGKGKKVGCNQGKQDPQKPGHDPRPDHYPADSSHTPVTQPVDPNEIIGPDGWMTIAEGDTVRWVSAMQSLPYTIYFENDPERATAAAQVVTVRLKLHPLMNMADFGIGTFGFGNHVFPVEGSPLQYQTRLDLIAEMNLYVDVVAGIDITTGEAFWIFSSIDPATGIAPTETDRGFLAVNDSTHIGEGYVTFTIKPKAALCHTGDTIGAQASIVFDINDPIETNRWVNTVDAVPPASMATVLTHAPSLTATPSSLEGELDSIRVVFSGADDATGMAAYRLYYTENGSAFRLAGRYLAGDTAVIAKQPNTTYTFFSLGEDNVGNIEPIKGEPDTLFGNTSVQLLANVLPTGSATITGIGIYTMGDTATLNVQPAEGYRLVRWTEGGVPQGTDTLLTIVAEENHTFTAELERISYPLTVNAAEGTTITASTNNTPVYQEVRHFDTLNIHIETSPCYGEILFSLNNNPLTADTTIVVHEAITITSTATQQVDTGYLFDTVCRYTAYTANGFNILSSATGASGTFNFQLPTLNLNGCDSIARLSLFVKPSHTLTFLANGGEGTMLTQQVCDGEETVLNGSTFTREGFFFAGWATSATATTADYADGGIITLTDDQTLYAVWSRNCVDRESNRIVTVCDSYYWNDSTYTTSGEYVRTRPSALPGGCDSIYRLHLTVKHSTENIYQIVSCQPYTWVDGQTYNADTTRQLSMTNNVGCDSTVTLRLTIQSTPIPIGSYQITVSADGHGSVTGGGLYNDGEKVTLMATANCGYRFSKWNDGNTENPRTVTATGDANYTAQFELMGTMNYTIQAPSDQMLTYAIDCETQTAMVTGYVGVCRGLLVIPPYIRLEDILYVVVAIGPSAFENCTDLLRVMLPATVDAIYESAFRGCTNLGSVEGWYRLRGLE